MNKIALIFCLFVFALQSCNTTSDFVSPTNQQLEDDDKAILKHFSDNGIKDYEMIRKGLYVQLLDSLRDDSEKVEIKEGDTLGIYFNIKSIDNESIVKHEVVSGSENPYILLFKRGIIFPFAIHNGIENRRIGDKIRVFAASAYGYSDLGLTSSAKSLIIDIDLNKKVDSEEINKRDEVLVAKEVEGLQDVIKTSTGLRVLRLDTATNLGDGFHKAKSGERVALTYKGTLLNDYIFDQSNKDASTTADDYFKFDFDRKKVILGWDEALLHLNVKDSAVLVIPSSLAYGSRDGLQIIPNDTSIYSKLQAKGILQTSGSRNNLIAPFSVLKFNVRFVAKGLDAIKL